MQPRIETISSKKLIGMCIQMTLNNNQTPELWKNFMLRRKEISNNMDANLISMQIYDPDLNIRDFTLDTIVNKWASVEVTDMDHIPDGMKSYVLPGGLYAVFHFKGNISAAPEFFKNIFTRWIPEIGYDVDNSRPHFELLGEKYRNGDPASEEDVFIPIKKM